MKRSAWVVWGGALTGYSLLAVSAWALSLSDAVPYNVRELFEARGRLAGSLLLPLVAYAVLVPPPALARWAARGGRGRGPGLVAALVGHALVAWLAARAVLPVEAIHDVVGAPVLGWPGEVEPMGRFVALVAGNSALLALAWIVVDRIATTDRRAPPRADAGVLLPAAALMLLAYLVVVRGAATDNLVELIRGGGNPLGCALLALGLLGLFVAGSAAARLAAAPPRAPLALAAIAGLALGGIGIGLGLEPGLVKYGREFSALQFLLSASRESYASGGALMARAVAGAGGIVGLLALVHFPLYAWGVRDLSGAARRGAREP